MGAWGQLFTEFISAQSGPSPEEALFQALALSVLSGGEAGEAQFGAAVQVAMHSSIVGGQPYDAVAERLATAFEHVQQRGLRESLEALSNQVPDEAKAEVFSAAAMVQYADLDVSEHEDAFLDDLASTLGLDGDHMQDLIDAVERQMGLPLASDAAEVEVFRADLLKCPQCGAPRTKGNQGRLCTYCESAVG